MELKGNYFQWIWAKASYSAIIDGSPESTGSQVAIRRGPDDTSAYGCASR